MNSFSQWIKKLQARVNQLKTIGLKSSSSLGVYSKIIEIPDNVDHAWIILTANEPMLFSAYIETPASLSETDEVLYIFREATNSDLENIVIIRRAETLVSGLSVRIVATSYFDSRLEVQ